VGFAAESQNVVLHARAKRLRKGVPLIVGNLGPATFGRDHNTLVLVDAQGEVELPTGHKLTLARELVRRNCQPTPKPIHDHDRPQGA
jgi:phosphopantothenoylcysteine decarboxylase/phosphopantothenate--cysteine ligase